MEKQNGHASRQDRDGLPMAVSCFFMGIKFLEASMQNLFKLFPLVVMAALYANVAWSDEPMVIEVIDGDTILVQEDGKNREVDIKRIDAPELSQPFGAEAKEALEKILLNKAVYIDDGNIFSPGKNRPVSWELIENGLAWCNNRIDRNDPIKSLSLQQDSMCNAELHARQKKLGLWAQPSEPPWIFEKKRQDTVVHETVYDIDAARSAAELRVWQKNKTQEEAKAKAEALATWERNNPEAAALKQMQEQLQQQEKLVKKQTNAINRQTEAIGAQAYELKQSEWRRASQRNTLGY